MDDPGYVVVGVDGSAESDAAVVWAANEALSRNARLRIVNACDSRYFGVWTLSRAFREELRSYAKPLVTDAADRAALILAPAAIETAVLVASPGRTLGLMSRHCELLVVGRTGRGALSRLVFGSTTREVLARSSCPVVAVTKHADAAPSATVEGLAAPRVIVVVRDAATNADALRFAYEYAQRHQSELHIVQANRSGSRSEGNSLPIVDEVIGWQARYRGVDTKIVEVRGDPAEFVDEICQPDDLLVVGHHRHSVWSVRPLGAYVLSVLHAAPCSVAVVPELSPNQ